MPRTVTLLGAGACIARAEVVGVRRRRHAVRAGVRAPVRGHAGDDVGLAVQAAAAAAPDQRVLRARVHAGEVTGTAWWVKVQGKTQSPKYWVAMMAPLCQSSFHNSRQPNRTKRRDME